jgi:diguanylate cyclase (GGDEF)-like protein
MRLATITNWAYGATVALTLLSGTTMLLASSAQERERTAVTQRYALDSASSNADEDAAALSEMARQYAISGDPADLIAYQREVAQLRAIELRTRAIRDAGASRDELNSLHEALRWADGLLDQQQAAIAARRKGDQATALKILFAPEYERELDRIRAAIERFQYRLDQRTDTALRAATDTSRLWRSTSEAMLAITGGLFLGVLYFVFRRRVLHPVVRLSDVVARLAAQDFDAVPPEYEQVDEIGDMAQALRIFRENGIERLRLEQERDADRTVRDLLSRMTQRMQSCDSVADLERILERFVPEVAPHLAGRLYLLDRERGTMVTRCSWGRPLHSDEEFASLACWALRRGVAHFANAECIDVVCDHIDLSASAVAAAPPDGDIETLCLPLVGQNGTLGLLYFEGRAPGGTSASGGELPGVYVTMLTENVALALDNLQLRDALRALAMADPLTTLANRRQLDQELDRQLEQAERRGETLACAMIDVDHFKRFNDDHGHDAGDAVLRAVAAELKLAVRDGNLVYRYGGEEFLVLLPQLDTDQAAERAEEIRARIARVAVRHEGQELGPVTVSIGVACAPRDCFWNRLVQTADAALLQAKRDGRNRVVSAIPEAV